MPQGTLAERIRAGAPASADSSPARPPARNWREGKETRMIRGQQYVLEEPLTATSR